MSSPTFRTVAYAANTTGAALLALSVAFVFDLPNPWWAALTVFITSQPLGAASGAVVARARYRIAGTLLGMAASLVMIPAFASSPELLIIAIATWLGLCIYVALLDRGPRSYTFLLAGYSVALVGLPLAGDPSAIFDSALARTEEILLGALCAALVHNLVLPQKLRETVNAKLAASLADARRWIDGSLAPEPAAAQEQQTRRRLAIDLTELRVLAANMRFEPGVAANEMRVILALEERLVALLPLLTAIEDRLAGLAGERDALPALFAHVAEVRAWIAREYHEDPVVAEAFLVAGRAALPTPGTLEPNVELLATSAIERLGALVTAWDECLLLADAARRPASALPARAVPLLAQATRRPLHVDHGLAALSGFAAAVAVIVTAAICWVTGWQQGGAAVGLAAANSAVFAFLDDPRPLQRLLPAWALAAVPVGALYLFAILPAIQDFVTLCLALLPLFFGTAFYLGTPKHTLHGLAFALISQSLISLQPTVRADFNAFAALSIASVLGTVVALVVTSLIRVVSAEWSSWRLLRAGWRELAGLADGSRPQTAAAWASRMLDRVGLLMPRLARAAGDERVHLADALRDLRLGVAIAELRDVADAAGGSAAASIDVALQGLARHVRGQARRGPAAPDAAISAAFDRVIAQIFALVPGAQRTRGLAAAAGLRRILFPDAPAYTSPKEARHAG